MKKEHQKKLLLVEDEVLIALAEQKAIENHGYQVVTAHSSKKALNLFQNQTDIDLILMDINLGSGLDGTETAKQILKLREVPIVFLSSHNEKEIVEKTEKITSYGYVVKNSGITVLDASIKMAFKLFEANQRTAEQKQQLREERDKAQSYLDLAGGMFIALDSAGIVTLINGKGREILGCKNEEIIGKNWFDHYLPVQIREQVKTVYLTLMNGEMEPVEFFENPILTRHGAERMIAWHNTILKDEKGNIVGTLSSGEDITEQKRSEAALKESETKFRSITEQATDFIFIKDQARRYTFINQAMQKLLGLAEKDLLGKTPEEIYGPEQGLIVKEVDDRSFAGETVNETRRLMIGGKQFFLNTIQAPLTREKGEVTSIMGIVRDFTQFQNTQQQLEAIFQMSLDMICVADINSATFIKVNPAFTRILGYSEKELLERPFLDFIHPDDLEPTIAVIDQNLKKGKKVLRFENRYRSRKGDYRWLEWTSHPLVEQGLTYAIAHDITERKAAEKELRNSEGSAKKFLETAKNRATAMMQLFDLLSRNRFPSEIPIKDYLPELVDRIVVGCPADLKVIKRLADVITPLEIAFSLGIIVHELVTNALQHAFPKGDEKSIEISVTPTDSRVIVIVQDNGIGFNSQKTRQGFGLELVHRLTGQLHGQFEIEQHKGTKCRLIFEL